MPKNYPNTDSCVSSRLTFIYSLSASPDSPCRYVGKTSSPLVRRLTGHISAAKHAVLPIQRWIMKQLEHHCRPYIQLLETVQPGDNWGQREQFWIAYYRAEGARLLNISNGGEGAEGMTRTPEYKAKMSASLRRGAYFACRVCEESFWRKPNEIKSGDNKFCSRKCYAQSLKGISRPISQAVSEKGRRVATQLRLARTHCPHGHPFSISNTKINKEGARICKTCSRIQSDKSSRTRSRVRHKADINQLTLW